MDFPCSISSFSSFKRFSFPGYTSVLVTGYSVDIYKWYFYLMIMVSDKNEDFRIYLITVFIAKWNKKVEKYEGVRKILNFHERGSWGEKSLGTTVLEREAQIMSSANWKWRFFFCAQWTHFDKVTFGLVISKNTEIQMRKRHVDYLLKCKFKTFQNWPFLSQQWKSRDAFGACLSTLLVKLKRILKVAVFSYELIQK
jgi:hypothetical protein